MSIVVLTVLVTLIPVSVYALTVSQEITVKSKTYAAITTVTVTVVVTLMMELAFAKMATLDLIVKSKIYVTMLTV